jgi:hypothetical protein
VAVGLLTQTVLTLYFLPLLQLEVEKEELLTAVMVAPEVLVVEVLEVYQHQVPVVRETRHL